MTATRGWRRPGSLGPLLIVLSMGLWAALGIDLKRSPAPLSPPAPRPGGRELLDKPARPLAQSAPRSTPRATAGPKPEPAPAIPAPAPRAPLQFAVASSADRTGHDPAPRRHDPTPADVQPNSDRAPADDPPPEIDDLNQMEARLQSRWASETDDGQWSGELRSFIVQAIEDGNLAATLQTAECRTTLCRLQLAFATFEDARVLNRMIGAPEVPTRAFLSETDDGVVVDVYTVRPSDDDSSTRELMEQTAVAEPQEPEQPAEPEPTEPEWVPNPTEPAEPENPARPRATASPLR